MIHGGSGVIFDNADLTNTNFTNVNFTSIVQYSQYKDSFALNFSVKTFKGTNFTNAVFSCSAIGLGVNGDIGSTCSAVDLSNKEFIDVNFSGAVFTSYYYSGSVPVVNFANSTFENCIFEGAMLGDGRNTIGVDLSNIDFSDTNFSRAKLYNVQMDNTDITHANFSLAEGLTSAQLSQTINYKNRDMNGIQFDGLSLSNWILRGQNLQNTSFVGATLSGVNFRLSDLRGTDLTSAIGTDSIKTLNTIWTDGIIRDFSMLSEDDSFSIRKYEPVNSGGTLISAKLDTSSTISGGSALTLERGADFEITNQL